MSNETAPTQLPRICRVLPHARRGWGEYACYLGACVDTHPRATLHATGYGSTPLEAWRSLQTLLAEHLKKVQP